MNLPGLLVPLRASAQGPAASLVRDLNTRVVERSPFEPVLGSYPDAFTSLGGKLFFTAQAGQPGDSTGVWVSDGSASGTRQLTSSPSEIVGAAAPPPARVTERTGLPAGSAAAGACVPAAGRLCLNGGRFAVEARWKDFAGQTGSGTGVGLTGDTGYFWFFGPENVEVMVKVLDDQALNGKFWVFFGALSNVEYTLTVTDTLTGKVKSYTNPGGRFASVGDTGAF